MEQELDEKFKRNVAEYALAEDRGVSLLQAMHEFAPGEEERAAIAQQIVEEKKHARLFQERAHELNHLEDSMLAAQEELYELGQDCVDSKDWIRCITCQNIIEELAMISFGSLFKRADERTRAILREIIEDEKKHLDFTLEQLAKWVKTDEDRQKVLGIQNAVMQIFLKTLAGGRRRQGLNQDEWKDFQNTVKHAYRMHQDRFTELGLEVPSL